SHHRPDKTTSARIDLMALNDNCSNKVKPPVPRSPDLQSAVSPNCIRQTARKSRRPLENPAARRIANPRYSRLKICATFLAARIMRVKAEECRVTGDE